MRAALASVIFTHGFYTRSFLKRCLTLSGLTRSRSEQSKDWVTTFCTQVRVGIPVVGMSLNCPNRRKRVAVGCNSNFTNNSHYIFFSQRLIQSADLFFRKLKSQTKIPTNSSLRTRGAKKKKKKLKNKIRATATACQMQTTERQQAL